MTKFLVICNNPRIASTKTQSIFCNKTSFAKDKIQKRRIFHDTRLSIGVFLKLKSVSKTLNLWNNTKVMKFQKNCQERGDRSLIFSPLSSQNSSQNALELKLFNRFYIWYFETNTPFQNSNTQTSFLKVSNNDRTRKLRKTYKL